MRPWTRRATALTACVVLAAGVAGDVLAEPALGRLASLVATIGALLVLAVLLPRLLTGVEDDPRVRAQASARAPDRP